MRSLDALDARLLLALDEEPASTALGLAHRLGISRNTVHARLQRLERDGSLRAPSLRVDPRAAGRPLVAFVQLSIDQSQSEAANTGVAAVPEVVEVHATTGDHDLLAKVVARDTADLLRVTNAVLACPGVLRANTMVSLDEIVPTRIAPLLSELAER